MLQQPDNWNLSRQDVGGVGIYRFELGLNVAPNRLWALLLPRVSNNAKILLNGALLGAHGSIEGDRLIWNTPFLVTVPSGLLEPGHNVIDVRVSAQANMFGRLLPPLIGADEFIRPGYERLYFGQIILSEMTELPLPLEQWIRFCFSFGFIMLAVMLIFICHFMDWKQRHKEQAIMIYTLFGIVMLLLLPANHLFHGIKWIMAGYAVMYSMLTLINALRFEQSKRHALVSLAGIGINIGLGLHDWANIFFMLNQPYLLQYGQPLIFLVMGRYLFKDYMSALRASEATSAELDQRVQAREHELQLSLNREKQAEQEKALLKERERIMADIHDAGRIQAPL